MSQQEVGRGSDSGQATLEYILMLVTAVMLFSLLYSAFLKPTLSKLATYASSRINLVLTNGDLHTLPFKAN